MAVIVNSQPERVLLSKNPIVFDLSTENYVISQGVNDQRRIDLSSDQPSAGDQLQLDAPGFANDGVSGNNIVWTFSNTPDNSGTQLPAYISGDIIPYIQELILYMNMNPAFNKSYVAYCDGFQAVTIRALNQGADWVQSWTFTGFSPLITQNITGADAEFEPDFQVRCKVSLDKGFGERIEGEFEFKIPDQNGDLIWDVSDTVDRLFPVEWMPSPSLLDNFSFISPPDSGQVILNVEFMEYFGATPDDNPIRSTDHFRVLKGGFKTYDKAESLISNFATPNRFMTWREEEVEIYQDSRNWLHFLNIDPGLSRSGLELRVQIQNVQGISVDLNPLTTFNLNYGTLYLEDSILSIPAGYDQLRLNLFNPGQVPFKYTLTVNDNLGNPVAGPFTFKVKDPSKNKASLLYDNSFGLPEEISLEGDQVLSSEATFETLLLPQKTSPQPEDLTDRDYNQRVTRELTLSTGALRKSDSKSLNEILTSPRLFFLLKNGLTWKKFAVRLKETGFRNGIKDYKGTNTLPERITLIFNEERSHSDINQEWL